MAAYHGDIRLGDTIDIKFTTVNTAGAPTQLAGTPAISAYPGNSTTQLTAGITLTVDFDSVTGLNNVRVVATSGNGYATATNYELVITTGTVGGASVVGYCVGSFSIENRSALMPTTATRTLDVSAGGEAGVDWANVGSPTTVVGLSGTTVKTATDVETDTADIQSRLPAALVSGRIDASVGAVATGAIDAAALAADAGTEIAAAVWDKDATGHQTQGTFGQAIGDPGADANTIFKAVVTDATGATVGVDTAAILEDTGTTLDGRIPAALVGGKMDANVGAISADSTAADRLEALMDGTITAAVNGVATTTSIPADGFTEATDDHFNGRLITFTSGVCLGQQTAITDYAGGTQTFTVTALTEAPGDNDTFVIS